MPDLIINVRTVIHPASGGGGGGGMPSVGGGGAGGVNIPGLPSENDMRQQYAARVKISKGYYDEDLRAVTEYIKAQQQRPAGVKIAGGYYDENIHEIKRFIQEKKKSQNEVLQMDKLHEGALRSNVIYDRNEQSRINSEIEKQDQEAQERRQRMRERATRIVQSTDPMERYKSNVRQANELLMAGDLTRDQHKKAVQSFADNLAPFSKAGADAGKSFWTQFAESEAQVLPYMAGLPLGAARGLSRLMASPALTSMLPIIGGTAATVAGIAGIGHLAGTQITTERSGATEYGVARGRYGRSDTAGFSSLLDDFSEGGYAGRSWGENMLQGVTFGLYGKLSSRRVGARAAGALSESGLTAEQMKVPLASLKDVSRITDQPVDAMAADLAGELKMIPRKDRALYADYAARQRAAAAGASEFPDDPTYALEAARLGKLTTQMRGGASVGLHKEQLDISTKTAENYAKIERSTEKTVTEAKTAGGIAGIEASSTMSIMGNANDIYNARIQGIDKATEAEKTANTAIVTDRQMKSQQAASDVASRKADLLKATGQTSVEAAMGVPEDAQISAARNRYKEALETQAKSSIDLNNALAHAAANLARIEAMSTAEKAAAGIALDRQNVINAAQEHGMAMGVDLYSAQSRISTGAASARVLSGSEWMTARQRAALRVSASATEKAGLEDESGFVSAQAANLRQLPGETDEAFNLRRNAMTAQGEALGRQAGVAGLQRGNERLSELFIAGRPRREQTAEKRDLRIRGRQLRRGEVRDVRAGGEFDADLFDIDSGALNRARSGQGGLSNTELIRGGFISSSDLKLKDRRALDGSSGLGSQGGVDTQNASAALDRFAAKLDSIKIPRALGGTGRTTNPVSPVNP